MSETLGRLLLVDDNEMNLDALSRRLRGAGYEVTAVPSGRDAIAQVAAGQFDAVLLDLNMPHMDGFATLRILREMYPLTELPVIMLTARGGSQDMIEAFKVGANDYLTKPIDFDVACQRIRVQIVQRRMRQGAASDPTLDAAARLEKADSLHTPVFLDEDEHPDTDDLGNSQITEEGFFFPHDNSSDDQIELGPAPTEGRYREVAPGTRIDRYTIVREIGRGGMAVVYEALHERLSRPAALKMIHSEMVGNPKALARLEIEARAAAAVDHPNVVAVYDAGNWYDTFYIAMQYIHGPTLRDIIRDEPNLHWRRATQLIMHACRGLGAAHRSKLIHRDIKPSNIIVGEDGMARIADFGLVRAPVPEASDQLTVAGQLLGTPHFMSPEQARGAVADHRSDIYSLGATYHALLTGRPPYGDKTQMIEVLCLHLEGPVPDPRATRKDLPPACSQIVRRCMAKKPEERYPSAEALLADLRKLHAMA